jgi:hypothetical protein
MPAGEEERLKEVRFVGAAELAGLTMYPARVKRELLAAGLKPPFRAGYLGNSGDQDNQ